MARLRRRGPRPVRGPLHRARLGRGHRAPLPGRDRLPRRGPPCGTGVDRGAMIDIGRTLLNTVGAAYLLPKRLRAVLMRACGARVGQALIFPGSLFRTTDVEIGDGSFVNYRCLFDGPVVIGRNVAVSTSVTFAGGGHELGPSGARAGAPVQRPIVVEDGAWIGANAVILGGVTIAAGCVIGAGAVVTRSTEPDGVYVGVPARRIRSLADEPALQR